jgi:hypothetical protein
MSIGAVSDAVSLNWPLPGSQIINRLLPSISLTAQDMPSWAPAVMNRIDELDALPFVDPDGSAPMHVPDVLAALEFLVRNMRDDTLPPWIGRLSSGGLELAWRSGDVEVEAVFDSAREDSVVIVSVAGNEWDAPVGESDSLFAGVVDRLSRSHLEYLAAG